MGDAGGGSAAVVIKPNIWFRSVQQNCVDIFPSSGITSGTNCIVLLGELQERKHSSLDSSALTELRDSSSAAPEPRLSFKVYSGLGTHPR